MAPLYGEPAEPPQPEAAAQAPAAASTPVAYSFGGDAGLVSKYIWRGQRLTNDWSLQPSGTLQIGNFSFNVWGTMDLLAVNEGDSLPISENPAAPSGASGLQGKFSEVDYTFAYSQPVEDVTINAGTIFYTFPERSASLPATTEIFGGVSLDAVPLAPAATLYVDVDETGNAGTTGLYFQLAGGHSVAFTNPRFPGLDFSGWVAFANSGFGNYYYGDDSASGIHDVNFTISAPITLGEKWSASAFVSYSALVGDFRDLQYTDPRDVYRGTAGSPAGYADTVWGGVTLSLAF
ncbi:MAG: hypothetical protein ACRD1R_21205 [Acidobacteriota bacterium]